MRNSKNIIGLITELTSMPDYQLMQKITRLRESLEILRGNYRDLKKLLVLHSKMPTALRLWDAKNQQALHALQQDVKRLLHNFVASAQSLVDHTRNLYKELCKPTGVFPEYEKEVDKRFATNPLAKFIVGLRQYCEHYKPPPVFSEMRYSREPAVFESRLKLDKSRLEEFSGWKSPAKQFLAEQRESIDLLEVVGKYYALVVDFYRWFDERLTEIYSKEHQHVKTKAKKLAKLVIQDIVQVASANTAQCLGIPDEAFAPILTRQEWDELKRYSINSPKRYEKLIAFLEKRTSLNQDLKQQIRRIYGIEG